VIGRSVVRFIPAALGLAIFTLPAHADKPPVPVAEAIQCGISAQKACQDPKFLAYERAISLLRSILKQQDPTDSPRQLEVPANCDRICLEITYAGELDMLLGRVGEAQQIEIFKLDRDECVELRSINLGQGWYVFQFRAHYKDGEGVTYAGSEAGVVRVQDGKGVYKDPLQEIRTGFFRKSRNSWRITQNASDFPDLLVRLTGSYRKVSASELALCTPVYSPY